jgi:hypothetical protein
MNKDNPFIYKEFIDQLTEAYFILKEKYSEPIYLFFVKAFLLGRIIELVLKTELILQGFSSSDLSKKNIGGHDLMKLLKLSKFQNENPLSTTMFDSIRYLNSFYNDKKYEYPQKDDVEVRNTAFLEEFISKSTKNLELQLTTDKLMEFSS